MSNSDSYAKNWRSVSLNDVAEKPQYGYTASAAEKGNAKFLRITDITELGINWNTVPFCQCSDKSLSKYKLLENDILFARIGATTGKNCIIKNPPTAVFASYLIRVRVTNSINPDFLYFYLQSYNYWQQINSSKHNNLKKGVNASILSSLTIPLPLAEEQKIIAGVLSLVQNAIAQQEKAIALTTELKKALMQKLFTEGTRKEPQKQTEIGLIPESWEMDNFEDFATLQRGKDLTKHSFIKGNVPVIGATSIIGFHNQANVKAPGVTVVRSGSSAGKPLYISEDFWAHNVVLFVKNFHGNNVKFVYYAIQHLDLTKYRSGVAVPTLNRNTFKMLRIARPKLKEQKKIVNYLDLIEAKLNLSEKKKQKLQDLFQTLLHQLMTAKIRVSELNLDSLNLDLEEKD